jgi:hypothetical protein
MPCPEVTVVDDITKPSTPLFIIYTVVDVEYMVAARSEAKTLIA